MKEVISFLKKIAENDDLRKRDDLRDFYGTWPAQLGALPTSVAQVESLAKQLLMVA
jgi:hypothetical protein